MRLDTGGRVLLAGVSAALQIVIFPVSGPLPKWQAQLAWIALTPLLVALLARRRDGSAIGWRTATLLAYGCGVCWYAGNCYWIYQTMYLYAGVNQPVALLLLLLFSLYLGLYHAAFGFLLWLAARRGEAIALLATAFLWVGVELARAHITSFPWDQFGMSQIDNYTLTSLAPTGGVYAISFVLVLINAAGAYMALRLRFWRAVLAVAGIVVVLHLPVQWITPAGHAPYSGWATLLQPNGVEGDDEPWLGEGYGRKIGEFGELSRKPANATPEDSKADVIIWPESPSPLIEGDPRFQDAVGELARQIATPLIIGDVARARTQAGGRALFNSASFFTAQGQLAGRYDKIHLVPFGEYIPLQSLLVFARALTANAGDTTPGRERVMFHTGGHTYGVFICYESIFADEVRLLARDGADVLVNISDDGWYGDTSAPWQHLNMARMRAIENRRWVLRDTNSGVTAAIDPEGKVAASAPRHKLTAVRVPFEFVKETTFYTRYGDVFAYTVTILGVVLLGFLSNRKSNLNL